MMSQNRISYLWLDFFFQDESDKTAGIVRFKTVYSNTDSRFSCTIKIHKNTLRKTTQQATYSLKSEKIGPLQWFCKEFYSFN